MFLSRFDRPEVINPPAIVREAFDEQALKREWDEACADAQDALVRKVEVLRKALARWPRVPNPKGGPALYAPEMRRFVRDVLGMPDQKSGGINALACRLLKHGAEKVRAQDNESAKNTQNRRRQVERAAIELATKYRLGADPVACMEALANLIEGKHNV